MVGRSGKAGERRAPLTANARTRPDCAYGAIEFRLSNMTCTCPAIRSLIACEPPLYGTCTMSVPVMYLKSSPPTCPGEPFARGRVEQLAGILPGVGDQLGHRVHRQRRRHREHQVPFLDQRDRLQVALDV